MKKYFLIVGMFLAVACRNDNFYPDDTTTFTMREMTVNVTPTTNSFSLVVTQKGGIQDRNILFDSKKSTAVINQHFYLPKELIVKFPNKRNTESVDVQIFPAEIKEPLVMSFYLQGSGGRIASDFIDTITVKLIPTLN